MLNDHCHRVSTHWQSINIITIILYYKFSTDAVWRTATVACNAGPLQFRYYCLLVAKLTIKALATLFYHIFRICSIEAVGCPAVLRICTTTALSLICYLLNTAQCNRKAMHCTALSLAFLRPSNRTTRGCW